MKFEWKFGVTEKCVLFLTAAAVVWGQTPAPAQGPGRNPGQGPGPGQGMQGPPMQGPPMQGPRGPGQGMPGPGMMRGQGMMHHDGPRPGGMREGPRGGFGVPGGKFWHNPDMVKRLTITADQQRKMDDVMQQSRIKLIDLTATLQKEEVMMEELMRGPQLDDAKILPAVDRIAQARAELEKANARMMLGIRHVLTPTQWEKLHTPMQGPNGPDPRQMGPRPMGPGARPGNTPQNPPREE